jgi:hypothetical protein
MSAPTKEYLLAKANMCRNLALTQIDAGEGEKAAENLMRMVKALGEVGIIIEKERAMKCLDCNTELNLQWLAVQDQDQLCESCYEKFYNPNNNRERGRE